MDKNHLRYYQLSIIKVVEQLKDSERQKSLSQVS